MWKGLSTGPETGQLHAAAEDGASMAQTIAARAAQRLPLLSVLKTTLATVSGPSAVVKIVYSEPR
jgi:hypothetical protein